MNQGCFLSQILHSCDCVLASDVSPTVQLKHCDEGRKSTAISVFVLVIDHLSMHAHITMFTAFPGVDSPRNQTTYVVKLHNG